MIPAPPTSAVYAGLRSFLLNVLPVGVVVLQSQQNRVPEPKVGDFVLMTETRRRRLATNIDSYADVRFTGAIAGTTMTVSAVGFGTILVGATVFGVAVAANSVVQEQLTGTAGGVGTYRLSTTQTLSSRVLASGGKTMMQETEFAIQLDVHGPASGDNAQVISTAFRDAYAVNYFAENAPGVVPLYADDPKQVPFVNEQSQWETRWVLEAMLQANPVLSVPQQFADSVEVELIDVDAVYPP